MTCLVLEVWKAGMAAVLMIIHFLPLSFVFHRGYKLIFSNISVLHLHYFKRLYFNAHQFFKVFVRFWGKIDKIPTLSSGKMLLKTLIIISLALENSFGERGKRF